MGSLTLGTEVDLFGVDLTVSTYDHATAVIMEAARERRSFAVSALAVHGLMEAVRDEDFRRSVNAIDLVVPDGQPVRWAMNSLHGAGLEDRVYGPDLTWRVIEQAAEEHVGIFLFGSTESTCLGLKHSIEQRFPGTMVEYQADRFREASESEDEADIARINASGAGVVLVGRGCPRQERWVSDHRGSVDAAMLAVGAAFDYAAGTLTRPPAWMQRVGLQWLYRLGEEPGRLWRRYLVTNSLFLWTWARALVPRRS